MNTCFFIGHRETGPEILPELSRAIEQHITEFGVVEFIVGCHGGFDRMVVQALQAAKQQHPHIILTRLAAYHPSIRPVSLPEGFSGSLYPPGLESVPPRYALARANRYMIANVSHLIAHVWHPASHARDLLEHARRRTDLRITNLGGLRPFSPPVLANV